VLLSFAVPCVTATTSWPASPCGGRWASWSGNWSGRPHALERVLARRVALCWAQAHLADLEALQNDRGATHLAAHPQEAGVGAAQGWFE